MRIKNVLQYLEATAARLPDKVAFADGIGGDGDEALTFSALLANARRVGSALCARGLCGKRVALLMDRHPKTIAAMFGVTYAGGCYICLDAAMPDARLLHILTEAQVALILCDAPNRARAGTFGVPVASLDDFLACDVAEESLAAVRRAQIDTDPLYIVFTSGSTGLPKGVVACHRSVIDYAEALSAALPLRENCVFGCQSPLCFDAPLKEILSTILHGATTYLIPRRLFSFPMPLLRYLAENGVNTVAWVVSAFVQISALGALEEQPPLGLRTVIFGSEVFPMAHYLRWRAALPEADFYQLYGPTEATGMSCVWHADRALSPGDRIPIGAPLDNTALFLLDDNGERVSPVPGTQSPAGEIYLRGSCVTLGYDHRPAETGAAFVQNPLQSAYPEWVYRTGDRACYNSFGELEFLGRRDRQIKRMGHRVELSEPEEAALRVDGVGNAVCVADAAQNELYLFYTGDAASASVEAALAERLPRYMLPRRVTRLDRMPLTDNGKTDRLALLALTKN